MHTNVNFEPHGTVSTLNRLSFFSGHIAAFFCALFILYLSVLFLSTWVCETTRTMVRIGAVPSHYNAGRIAGLAAGQALWLVPVLYCGVAFGRFLLRAMPPQFSNRSQFPVVSINIFIASIYILLSVTFLDYAPSCPEPRHLGVTVQTVIVFVMP